ncbi:VCBS repeat protein [Algoriphagus ratkowskyi]|nr:VCBS repeat-containing protein [Algoriphagus ratkowskyi]PZX60399.1 VCBS repeat protein [Algoriphagus ratkowskyi]
MLTVVLLHSCNPISERKQPPPSLERLASMNLKLDGEKLADVYCGSCHLKPEPELLDKKTWKNKVLPDMRKRMGLLLPEDFGQPLPEDMGFPKGVYSATPLIKVADWEKILTYYIVNSPDSPLPQSSKELPSIGIPGFVVSRPEFPNIKSTLTTMIRVESESGNLWIGDRLNRVYVLDSKNGFKIKDSILTDVAPVDIFWHADRSFDLLTMGVMDPSNDSLGVISRFWKEGQIWHNEELLSRLIRPVHFAIADWNGDGLQDKAVSQFGDHVGKMSVFLTSSSDPKEVILSAEPGARRAMAVDFDGDGDLDVLGLMAQAREGVYVWLNQGENQFKKVTLLTFSPVFGVSDFKYEDINGDGHKDIIIVNGDNADLSIIPKNYHGVRVYLNNGSNEFKESWFYPLHGASSIEIADFDGDEDLDLFVLAFYPEGSQESTQDLVYFRQKSTGGFDPFILNQNFDTGMMTLTSGDIDGDGDLDVFIGSFEFEDLFNGATKHWKPFIFLENRTN